MCDKYKDGCADEIDGFPGTLVYRLSSKRILGPRGEVAILISMGRSFRLMSFDYLR